MSSEKAYREPPLKIPKDTSRDQLEAALMEIVESDPALVEKAKNVLDRLILSTSKNIKLVSGIELSPEQAELLANLEAQYPKMKTTLEKRNISTAGMPTWEQIKKELTQEVLNKALKLAEPALLLVPPITRQEMVDLLLKYKGDQEKHGLYFASTYFGDKNRWDGGKAQTESKWRVKIDEGIQDVEADPEINNFQITFYQAVVELLNKLQAQGLDVMNDAISWLTLLIKSLDEGKVIDSNQYGTILNAKNYTNRPGLGNVHWQNGAARFSYIYEETYGINLRLRGSIEIDVPQLFHQKILNISQPLYKKILKAIRTGTSS